jgi:hypothetical protein
VSIERKEKGGLLEEKVKKRKSAEGAKAPGGQGDNKQSKTSNKKGKGGGTPGGNSNPTLGLTVGTGMKFCPLCHSAGLPETVYHTHNLADCNKKDVFSQALSAAVKPKPAPSAGRGHCQLHPMEHNRVEMTSRIQEANTRKQICRAFRAATSSEEEVCKYLRGVMMDPTLEDTYRARCMMPMYFDPHGNAELQTSLPMATS